MWSANVRRRSPVECCSDLRKCSARVEERRLIARSDIALYLELVVAVVILLSSLVVIIPYNKQTSCFFVPTILLVPDNTCVNVFGSRTPPYSLFSFIGAGGMAGLVFFALHVVDGCRLGGDVCCADCMYTSDVGGRVGLENSGLHILREGMLGGIMCACAVCEDMLFCTKYVRCCTMSVVMRSNNYTLDGVSGKRRSVRVRGGVRVWGISRVVPYCRNLVFWYLHGY